MPLPARSLRIFFRGATETITFAAHAEVGSPSLRPNGHGRADVRRLVELAGFPVRHPDTTVRGGNTGQISLVQSVTGRELDEERHRRADKMRTARLIVFPAIDVRFHDAARIIHVVAVQARPVIDV